jgi:hypothetical protein
MPTELKRRLADEATRRAGNLNDVAVGILADRFSVPVSPTGRRSVAAGASGVVVLRMPDELKQRLRREAVDLDTNLNQIIVQTLADELGITLSAARRKEPMAQTDGRRNGRVRSEDRVRVAIVGVGNCANSLLQGVEYYKDAAPDDFVPGLMHVDLGGYHVRDVEFTAAFDVTTDKVGKDLADAIWAQPNDTIKFANVPKTGVSVSRGMTHDGIGKYLSQIVV